MLENKTFSKFVKDGKATAERVKSELATRQLLTNTLEPCLSVLNPSITIAEK